MSHEIILINIISAVLGALILMYYYKVVGLELTRKKSAIFIIAFGILNGIISTYVSSYIFKPFILTILSVLIIILLLKIPLSHAFLSFSIYTFGLGIGNAIVPLLLNLLNNKYTIETINDYPFLLLFSNIFVNAIALILFILVNSVKAYIKIICRDKFLAVLTTAAFVVMCLSFALYYNMKEFNSVAYIITAMIIISYCIFIIVIWFSRLKKAISEEDLAQQKFYNESLRSTLFELRRFKHDWGNCLTVINSMLKMNKIEELKQYVSELIARGTEYGGTEIYNIKNAGLFGIISSKINQAREMGVNVDISVIGEVENIHGIKISELCEVVGIYLDNAIEEATKGPKSISVDIQNDNDRIIISISNRCIDAPDLNMIDKEGYSTKGTNRGMGLAIAKKILNKYDNILHTTIYENGVFTQTIEIS